MPFQLRQRDFQSASTSDAGANAVRFQQQGQVDWTNLGANSVNASIHILSRISAAGIDPFTIVIGQAIGGSLLWRDEGRERFDKALQSCQGLAGYRNVLWFGFGVKHIANVLTATDQGSTCAALCACLAECYTVTYAAEIMMEMTKASEPTTETTPSLAQWRNLVQSCAGLVTNSTFGVRAEQLMRLDGEARIAAWGSRCDQGRRSRGIAHKTQIAETLLGLAKLSRRVLHQMTIVGHADAGLIAAIADWLLGLDVEIREGRHQEPLFRNCSLDKQPQLLVIFEKDVPQDSLQCMGQTYRLPDATELIRGGVGLPTTSVLSGRVPWENAFEYTFGRDFERLMMMKMAFGRAIGSAARIYQGLFEGDEGLPPESHNDCRSYFRDSFGLAYVHYVYTQFPELKTLRDDMISAARIPSVLSAMVSFEAQITSIATGCGCWRCTPQEDESPKPPKLQRGVFCLVYITHSIIKSSRALSGISTELRPMRAGLELMYDEGVKFSRSCHPKGRYSPFPALESAAVENILEFRSAASPQVGGERLLLDIAQVIFGGNRTSNLSLTLESFVSAHASNGLCYYLDMLIEPLMGAGLSARVHVIAGRIEHNGRPYDLIRDGGAQTPSYSGGDIGPRPPWHPGLLERLEKCHGGQLDVLVAETMVGLDLEYGVSKGSTVCNTFGPARAVQAMYRNEGLVACCRDGTCLPSPQFSDTEKAAEACHRSGKPFCRSKVNQEEIVLVHGDIATQLVAATSMWNPIMQRDECIPCCIRRGIMSNCKHIAVIMGKQGVVRSLGQR